MPARLREAIESVRRISNDGRLGADQQPREPLPLGPTPEDRPLARIAATRRSGASVVALAIALAVALLGGLGLALLYGGRDLGRAAVPTTTAAPPEAAPGPLPTVSGPLPPITEIVRVPPLPTPTAPAGEAPPPDPAAGALPLPPPPKPAPQPTGAGQAQSEPGPLDRAIDALLRDAES